MYRITNHRVDDSDRKNKITMARDFIYMKAYKVKSKAVENVLALQSMVPTAVSAAFWPIVALSQGLRLSLAECIFSFVQVRV
jgi:hypothetical protein